MDDRGPIILLAQDDNIPEDVKDLARKANELRRKVENAQSYGPGGYSSGQAISQIRSASTMAFRRLNNRIKELTPDANKQIEMLHSVWDL